jgi:hypothetical protein
MYTAGEKGFLRNGRRLVSSTSRLPGAIRRGGLGKPDLREKEVTIRERNEWILGH